MDTLTWTTRWEVWRDLIGPPNSRQERAIKAFLQTRPCLLYWGDSWFSTPLYLNLARQSLLRIEGMAMLIGKPGATASELFTPARARNIAGRLISSPFDAVCLSAGGNDQLSERLAKIFVNWMPPRRPAKMDAQAAFDIVLDSKSLDAVRARYEIVLDTFGKVKSKRPHFKVLGHSYAPIQRIGVAADLTVANVGLIAWVKGDAGPWLWKIMKHVLEDEVQGKQFAKLLLQDGFRDMVLGPLSKPKAYGDLFSYADFTNVPGVVEESFWYDEIHPTEGGFEILAKTFNANLRNLMPFAKQAAIK